MASKSDKVASEHESWARFDAEIARGLADVERGALLEADALFDRLEAKYREMDRATR